MTLNWNALERELLKGMYPTPRRGTYTPTLVLGLGGTGIKALRYLKSVLERHEGNWVRLLGIDSDSTENEKLSGLLPHLSEKELVILDQEAAVSALSRASQGQAAEAHILKYLPQKLGQNADLHQEVRKKIAAQKGAGQLRRAGRLLLHGNLNGGANVLARFQAVYQEVRGLAAMITQQAAGLNVEDGAKIFILSSLAGGTGAGILLDSIALLRSLFQGAQDRITVFTLLPGPLLERELHNPAQERVTTRGNAIAALRELQAFDQGAMSQYIFTLSATNRIGPLNRFVDDIYLLADHSRRNVPANSYLELTQAAASFLYVFVGEGVGATHASGEINGAIDMQWRTERIPRVFCSLGIGVMEYPVNDLATYLVRSTLGKWAKQWSKAGSAAADVRTSVESLLAGEPLSMKAPGTLRARLMPVGEELKSARFLDDSGQRKAFLSQPDDTFVKKGQDKVLGIDSALESWVDTLRTNADMWRNAAHERIGAWALEISGPGVKNALQHVVALQQCLDKFNEAIARERDRRDSAITRLKEDLAKLARKIHFWDFGLDVQLRRKFLDKVSQYLQFKAEEKVDAFVIECLSDFQNSVRSIKSRIEILSASVTTWIGENDREMDQMVGRSEPPGFVQRVVDWKDFPAWVKSIGVEVPDLTLQILEWEGVLRTAFAAIKEPAHTALRGLNVIHAAKRDPQLLRRIKTLEVASEPMVHLKEFAPAWEQLIPQKFVAGNWADANDPFVSDNFSPPPGRLKSTAVQTTNQHLVACAQTCHGFGAAHWSAFEAAEVCYRSNPWLFHVLEDFEALPALQLASLEEAETLQSFGLALMFELVLVRGSNYYGNLVALETEPTRYFAVFAAQRSATAAALKATKLIAEPLPSQNRPGKLSPKLGDSLDSALDGFKSPDAAPFREALASLLADFVGYQGRQKMAGLVREYVNGDFSRLTQIARERRDVLEKISAELDRYAKSLA